MSITTVAGSVNYACASKCLHVCHLPRIRYEGLSTLCVWLLTSCDGFVFWLCESLWALQGGSSSNRQEPGH